MPKIQFYLLSPKQSLDKLQSIASGLSANEVRRRLKIYGKNELKAPKTPLWRQIIEPFASYFTVVIIIAALISLYEQKWFEAIIISVILLVNALIYYGQQMSVGRVLKTLRNQDRQDVEVVRSGRTVSVASALLVPGDIIHITEGMKIPADGRLIEAHNLQLNESLLTGESLPVHKSIEALTNTKEVYDQSNMLFKGSYVQSGTGLLLITQTGNLTQLGAINTLTAEAGDNKTPIEKKIDALTKKLILIISSIAVIVFILTILRGTHIDEALRYTLSITVSAVPEGLPVAMTLVLLVSAHRMAKQKALVKKLGAMETMGAITLIVTDKTGTITKNQLTVADTFTQHRNKSDFHRAISASLNGNQDHAPDPLDQLLVEVASTSTPSKNWKKVKDLPFNQQLRISGVVWKTEKDYILYFKGAPEAMLRHTTSNKAALLKLSDFTTKGYRTIGFGHKKLKTMPNELKASFLDSINFDGFVGLSDQLRPNISKAVNEARQAGVKVVMLTGDHIETAQYIGRQTGILSSEQTAVDSKAFINKNPEQIRQTMQSTSVFGRVLPEHKFALLRAVKGHEITAMTGDGVNDIPALVESDAGLAMGSGADAAKDASDIVLINSNFMTIIHAIRSGRTVLANIRKMIVYLLGTNGGEVLTILLALMFNIPLPLTAIMLLWVNLVTDGVTVIPIGLADGEHQHMKQPPRSPNASLLDKVHTTRAILFAVTMSITTLGIFKLYIDNGIVYAQTMAFLSIIVIQWANALNVNFDHYSWIYNFIRPNNKLMLAIAGSIAINCLVFYTPIRSFFGIEYLTLKDTLIAIIVPCTVSFITSDLHKLLTRKITK
ncbi:cation-transporting P-type ATPase [Candidatus Saccharibacteria bacterium]|nr:cation-transporting P-type ATPase [Candidatus Saccharibacteria bacterium]